MLLVILVLGIKASYETCPNGKDSISIQTNWIMNAQYQGFQVARELGYYSDECLNVGIKLGMYRFIKIPKLNCSSKVVPTMIQCRPFETERHNSVCFSSQECSLIGPLA